MKFLPSKKYLQRPYFLFFFFKQKYVFLVFVGNQLCPVFSWLTGKIISTVFFIIFFFSFLKNIFWYYLRYKGPFKNNNKKNQNLDNLKIYCDTGKPKKIFNEVQIPLANELIPSASAQLSWKKQKKAPLWTKTTNAPNLMPQIMTFVRRIWKSEGNNFSAFFSWTS